MAPATSSVLSKSTAPETPRVPRVLVFPLAALIVNSVPPTSKSPSIPVAPVTSNVPATTVLPVPDATVNLLVLILKSSLPSS